MPANPEVLKVLRELSVLHAPPGKPFILKSGKESMHYVDVRLAALSPHGLRVIAGELFWTAMSLKTGACLAAGVALGGCPLATGVSSTSLDLSESKKWDGNPWFDNLPVWDAVYVRPEAKDHGTGKLVEGHFEKGWGAVLFEDVVTSGGSSLKAIAALRDAGIDVKAVVAVLDREEGGGEKISAEVPFRALCTLRELLAT
jgi:orotate phosphoribosyltransferase